MLTSQACVAQGLLFLRERGNARAEVLLIRACLQVMEEPANLRISRIVKKQYDLFVYQARLLDTIGTTRGFGDHDLRVAFCSLPIKPFLTPQPEVSVLRLLIYLNWYWSHQIGAVVTDLRVIIVTAWWNEVCKINSNSFLYRNPLGQRRCKRKHHNWLSKSTNNRRWPKGLGLGRRDRR